MHKKKLFIETKDGSELQVIFRNEIGKKFFIDLVLQ